MSLWIPLCSRAGNVVAAPSGTKFMQGMTGCPAWDLGDVCLWEYSVEDESPQGDHPAGAKSPLQEGPPPVAGAWVGARAALQLLMCS